MSIIDRREIVYILKYRVILLFIKGALLTAALPAFAILKLLKPLLHIRIGLLFDSRLGHLAANTELYLRRRAVKGLYREVHIFISGEPANHQLLKMIKRRLLVLRGRWYVWIYAKGRSLIKDPDLWIILPAIENFYSEFNNIPPQLSFTPQEEARGKKLLKGLGIKPGEAFVCFHARDKAYLEIKHPYYSPEEWACHDYRNCDIRNYLTAAGYLTSLGIYAIRMGYVVERELESDDPRIIDYAIRHRSDFGDIYLSARCKFFIASDGGMSSLPWIFNVPVVYSNSAPAVGAAGWRKGDIFVSKKLWCREKGRFLTFREILACGADRWNSTEQYVQAGIEIIENTPEEIFEAVREMNERLDGTWDASPEDEELQRRYRDIIPMGHRVYDFPSRIGAEFLRQNRKLLELE